MGSRLARVLATRSGSCLDLGTSSSNHPVFCTAPAPAGAFLRPKTTASEFGTPRADSHTAAGSNGVPPAAATAGSEARRSPKKAADQPWTDTDQPGRAPGFQLPDVPPSKGNSGNRFPSSRSVILRFHLPIPGAPPAFRLTPRLRVRRRFARRSRPAALRNARNADKPLRRRRVGSSRPARTPPGRPRCLPSRAWLFPRRDGDRLCAQRAPHLTPANCGPHDLRRAGNRTEQSRTCDRMKRGRWRTRRTSA